MPKRWIPHRPWPKQIAFLLLPDEEALFGGAAGGGKSDALLMGGLQYVDVPRYAALLLRRKFTDLRLPGALIPRAHEWLQPTAARWNEQAHEWKFPSGATVTFGYCDSENDIYRYQSSEFQFIGFDEATQFTERQYTYLQSRLRRLAGAHVPIRARGATNPGGVGHSFFFDRFVDPAGKRAGPFIPSKLRDNPALDAEAYLKRLAHLDPVTRAQLEHGIWTARYAGALFDRAWITRWLDERPTGLRLVRYWDLAATEPWEGNKDPDWTAGALVGSRRSMSVELRGDEGPVLPRLVLCDVRRCRRKPAGVEDLIRQTAIEDGTDVEVCIAQERGAAGKNLVDHIARHVLRGYRVRGVPEVAPETNGVNAAPDHPKRAKILRAGPASAAMQRGEMDAVRGLWVQPFFDEAEAFPSAGVHDDQVDAMAGAVQRLNRPEFWAV